MDLCHNTSLTIYGDFDDYNASDSPTIDGWGADLCHINYNDDCYDYNDLND